MTRPKWLASIAPGAALIGILLFIAPGQAERFAAGEPQGSADPARLYETVRYLSSHPDGSPKTRFTFHPDMDGVGLWIQERLAEALAPAGERASTELWPFFAQADTCGTCTGCPTWDPALPYRSTLYNIIGTLQGMNPGGPKFLITAHYDAIACRTSGWEPESPGGAPGADDNASGTAAVLELARLLATDEPYEFDIEFVLFDGEELGLLGSTELAEEYDSQGQEILGVLNMDMIGYNPRVDSLVVMTNRRSAYLADFILDTERLDPQDDFHLSMEVRNIGFSDHGPFWDRGYPGLLLIENVEIGLHNPNYHKSSDTVGYLTGQGTMMAKGVNAFLNTLRRLQAGADGPPRLHMSDGSVVVAVRGITSAAVAAVPGDTVRIEIGALNAGGLLPPFTGTPVRLYRILDDRRQLLLNSIIPGPLANGERGVYPYSLVASASDAGAITVEAELGEGSDIQLVRKSIPVRAGVVRVVRDYMAPNPVRDPSRAGLMYELSNEATVRITIYDLHGHDVGGRTFRYIGEHDADSRVITGLNRVPLDDLVAGEIAPGVYIYLLEIFGDDGPGEPKTGKFAVVR